MLRAKVENGGNGGQVGDGSTALTTRIPEGWDKVLLKDVSVVNEKTIAIADTYYTCMGA